MTERAGSASRVDKTSTEPAYVERDQQAVPPMPEVVAPEGLTLEGLSVNPDPDEVHDGRAMDGAHTDHDDVSDTREGASGGGRR